MSLYLSGRLHLQNYFSGHYHDYHKVHEVTVGQVHRIGRDLTHNEHA